MISDRIRLLREKTGVSARKFAESIGMRYTTYYGYETGKRMPNAETLLLIAKALKCTPSYLMGWEEQEAEELQRSVVPLIDTESDTRLGSIIKNYNQLNEAGKDNLAKYAENLTYVPEYTRFEDE